MMYWFERIDYQAGRELAHEELELGRKHTPQESLEKARAANLGVSERNLEIKPYTGYEERLCERADDQGLLHACNDTWLEVRTWNNDIRGVMTLFGVAIYWMFWGWQVAGDWVELYSLYSTGRRLNGVAWSTSDITGFTIAAVATVVMFGAGTWALQRFFLRYELFTQRWIRVRFNRKTGKVYLLRPKYAGGLMVFDWKQTDPALNPATSSDTPMLHWGAFIWSSPEVGGPGAIQFVGRRTSFQTKADWMAFWEYIRRYMAEGPQAVPAPKRVIGYGPSLREAWISITQWYPKLQQPGAIGKISDGVTFLILPLILLMVVGNFLGQCLTWNARFPKEIEDAGR